MERRAFVTGSLGLLGVSLCAAAQQAGRVARVGVLLNSSGPENLRDLREGLRELGYIEGQTITWTCCQRRAGSTDCPRWSPS
jgi:hypothetical protein